MSVDRDASLRRILEAAHEGDPVAPGFDELLARPRPGRSRRLPLWLPVAATAVISVMVLLPWLHARRERQALDFARELSAWRAPTDRLIPPAQRPLDPLRGLGGPSVLGDTNDLVTWR